MSDSGNNLRFLCLLFILTAHALGRNAQYERVMKKLEQIEQKIGVNDGNQNREAGR